MAAKKRERVRVYWVDDNYEKGPVQLHYVEGSVYDKTIKLDERAAGYRYKHTISRSAASLSAAAAIDAWRAKRTAQVRSFETRAKQLRRLLARKVEPPKSVGSPSA